MYKKKRIPWNKGKGDYIKGDKNPAWKNGLYVQKEWLFDQYIIQKKTIRDIAKESNSAIRTIARWLKIHQIPVRKGMASLVNDRKGEKNGHWKGGKPKCIDCEKEIEYGKKFCIKCAGKRRRGKMINNHHNKILAVKQLVRSYVQNMWRPKIFERDRFVCQKCKKIMPGELNAHHKQRLELIVNSFISKYDKDLEISEHQVELYSLIIGSSEINDLSNGVTLCQKCHKKIHKGKRQDYYEIIDDLYLYRAEVLDVYDADTFTVLLDIGFNIFFKTKIRLWGINAPEIRTRNKKEKMLGQKARDFVKEKILNKKVKIRSYKSGKFGRYLVDVYLEDDTLLNDLLIEKGFAREYFGEKRTNWFDD